MKLYRSKTYAKLSDPNTKLYIQSVDNVYSLLDEEMKNLRDKKKE